MVLRIVLGAVFLAMAVGQLASFGEMSAILAAYRLVDGGVATALAVALIGGELVAGAWFLARPRSRALTPVWVFTAVSVVWAALAVQAYARGLTVANCGCFGLYLTQSLGWFVLVQDTLLLGYAAVLLRGARRTGRAATGHHSPEGGKRHDHPETDHPETDYSETERR